MSTAPSPPPTFEALSPRPITYRQLPDGEYYRLKELWPWKGEDLAPNPQHFRIVVAERGGEGGEIIGYWGAVDTVHAEPLWIHPDLRGNPGVGRGLLLGILQILQESKVPVVFILINPEEEGADARVAQAERLGFAPLGVLYAAKVPELKEREG